MVVELGQKLAAPSPSTEPLFRNFSRYIAYEVVDDFYLLSLLSVYFFIFVQQNLFNQRICDHRGQLGNISELPDQFYEPLYVVGFILIFGYDYPCSRSQWVRS